MYRKIGKPNKYCKLFGVEIEYEKNLNDAEVRLYHLYLRIVDWDIKHKETFGSVEISIRSLKQFYLSNWSVGKLSYTIRSLIKRGWLEKREDGRMSIKHYGFYRLKNVQVAEQLIQKVRQGVQLTEQDVQLASRDDNEKVKIFKQEKAELIDKMSFRRSTN